MKKSSYEQAHFNAEIIYGLSTSAEDYCQMLSTYLKSIGWDEETFLKIEQNSNKDN